MSGRPLRMVPLRLCRSSRVGSSSERSIRACSRDIIGVVDGHAATRPASNDDDISIEVKLLQQKSQSVAQPIPPGNDQGSQARREL